MFADNQSASRPKRVFVRIREQNSSQKSRSPLKIQSVPPILPQPPLNYFKSDRKRFDVLQCHTPDQGGGKPAVKANFVQKTNKKPPTQRPGRQIISRNQSPLTFMKEANDSVMLSQSPLDAEDSLCMPYELQDRPQFIRKQRNAFKSPGQSSRHVDLKRGSFSKKKIISAETSLNEIKPNYLNISNDVLQSADSTVNNTDLNHSTRRVASPMLSSSRNSRYSQLSRQFRLDKSAMQRRLGAQKLDNPRSISCKENQRLAPWKEFVSDLESISNLSDNILQQNNTIVQRRAPIKVRPL